MYSQQAAGNGERRPEVAAIEERVSELEKAQQQESVEDFVGLLAAQAVWVTGGGRRLTGRDEIHAFTKKVLPGAMKDSTATYEVVHVSFVRPDVAVVNVRQRPVTHDGELLEGQPEGRPLYVMAEEEGQWEIVAAQNTIYIEGD
jgi:uncharacterized protein (TIGR02246 family)